MWSETGRAGKLRPGFCLGKPQGALMLLHPGFLLCVGHEQVERGKGAVRHAKAPTAAPVPDHW